MRAPSGLRHPDVVAAEAPTLDLRDNYRSTPEILGVAMSALALQAPLRPLNDNGHPVLVQPPPSVQPRFVRRSQGAEWVSLLWLVAIVGCLAQSCRDLKDYPRLPTSQCLQTYISQGLKSHRVGRTQQHIFGVRLPGHCFRCIHGGTCRRSHLRQGTRKHPTSSTS